MTLRIARTALKPSEIVGNRLLMRRLLLSPIVSQPTNARKRFGPPPSEAVPQRRENNYTERRRPRSFALCASRAAATTSATAPKKASMVASGNSPMFEIWT